jgi:hypothetical protein
MTMLSKTKLLNGLRCLKSLYLTVHHPELATPTTPEDQARFDQGTAIGIKAREYYPGGVLIENAPWDFGGSLAKTRQLIDSGVTTIYEAAFEYQGCYARLDIIQYNAETKCWCVFEVKSSTKVKPEHFEDAGLQVWIAVGSGLSVEQINILHVNNQCPYPDLQDLFTVADVTSEVMQRQAAIHPQIQKLQGVLQERDVPDVDIGPHCTSPYDCVFKQHCWQQKQIPKLSVFNLPRIGKKQWVFYQDGILHLDDPRVHGLNTLQERMVTCFKTKRRYVHQPTIEKSLAEWTFPLIFLDFETINPAIPRYDGSRPYEQIPFQFSAHIWPAFDAEVSHCEFLHDSLDDPRPALIEALLEACGHQGSIVSYNAAFEAQCITALAIYAPQHQGALQRVRARLVDPLPIVRDAVYDTAFHGSFSLKAVAPALLGDDHSYEGMVVADGGAAQRAFEELIASDTPAGRKVLVRKAMLEYCEKDTFVMVELVRWLFEQGGFVL